jgi:hypothetical protein
MLGAGGLVGGSTIGRQVLRLLGNDFAPHWFSVGRVESARHGIWSFQWFSVQSFAGQWTAV